ncbi:hypothetical protein BDP27DRAFT_1361831 [Rhodocollybia butyracea]|uniref:Uncharacterized protein n=1 Tax=Rhodocollybia butyracea TaxID=206335 RepID=A0A9P5PYC1_9AGAR|nr:hypothetical protein BDP27DRAFT_1361831 [Rhodocollybia butyracea]
MAEAVESFQEEIDTRPEAQFGESKCLVEKSAPLLNIDLETLSSTYGCSSFVYTIEKFLCQHNLLKLDYWDATPAKYDLYKRVCIIIPPTPEISDLPFKDTVCATAAQPAGPKRRKPSPAQFDTVLARKVLPGSRKESLDVLGPNGLHVAQVHAIFNLPEELGTFAHPLAYVEWFTPLQKFDKDTLMYQVERSSGKGVHAASIIPVTYISRSCHLYPVFGKHIDPGWTSENNIPQGPSTSTSTSIVFVCFSPCQKTTGTVGIIYLLPHLLIKLLNQILCHPNESALVVVLLPTLAKTVLQMKMKGIISVRARVWSFEHQLQVEGKKFQRIDDSQKESQEYYSAMEQWSYAVQQGTATIDVSNAKSADSRLDQSLDGEKGITNNIDLTEAYANQLNRDLYIAEHESADLREENGTLQDRNTALEDRIASLEREAVEQEEEGHTLKKIMARTSDIFSGIATGSYDSAKFLGHLNITSGCGDHGQQGIDKFIEDHSCGPVHWGLISETQGTRVEIPSRMVKESRKTRAVMQIPVNPVPLLGVLTLLPTRPRPLPVQAVDPAFPVVLMMCSRRVDLFKSLFMQQKKLEIFSFICLNF